MQQNQDDDKVNDRISKWQQGFRQVSSQRNFNETEKQPSGAGPGKTPDTTKYDGNKCLYGHIQIRNSREIEFHMPKYRTIFV